MAKIWKGFLRNVTTDVQKQFYFPTRSVTGSILTRRWEKHNEPLIQSVIEAAQLTPDSNIMEIGHGRGYGLGQCLDIVNEGEGRVFGFELSPYMQQTVYNKYTIEVQETDKLVLDQNTKLINLPYPNDFMDCIYHVDVFYFWGTTGLPAMFRELYRVLKPGSRLLCGMELNRLRNLEKYGIINEGNYNPLRYMMHPEPNGFRNVKMEYKQIAGNREIQLIHAQKADAKEAYYDPDFRLRRLEVDIKKHMAMQSVMNSQYRDESKVRQATMEVENQNAAPEDRPKRQSQTSRS